MRRGRSRYAAALTCLAVLLALAGVSVADAASTRTLQIALDGFLGAHPAFQLTVRYQNAGGRPGTVACPPRCLVTVPAGRTLHYSLADSTATVASFNAYELKYEPPYEVASYGACQHPNLTFPTATTCQGSVRRSTFLHVTLRYRPLLTVRAVGTVLDIRPVFDSGVVVSGSVPGQDGATASCTFKIESFMGTCSKHLPPETATVHTSDSATNSFVSYDGPCAGQDGGVKPSNHDCTFTLRSDVIITATEKPPCAASHCQSAALSSNVRLPPQPRAPFGPFLADFQANGADALDQLFKVMTETFPLRQDVAVALLRLSGVSVKARAGGAGARAARSSPLLFSGGVRAATNGMTSLVPRLTAAGRRFFARHGTHTVSATGTYDPPTGPPVTRNRTLRLRS